jgi:alkylation response protein AidB-like acyl-CoA dehydrogenase
MNAAQLVAPVAEDILRCADEVESTRKLPPALFEKLENAGLFSIYSPKAFGGLELPLPEALQVVEEVARRDGSTGWTVALGFGNDVFTSCLPEASAALVLGKGSSLIAGSAGFAVQAVVVDGGYCVTGQWQFASGASNARWVNVAAPIFEGPAPRMGPHGMPEMVMAFMKPGEVQVVDTWHVTGLRGSASHDLRADAVFVPHEMTGGFSMMGAQAVRESTLAKIPLMTLAAMMQAPPVCLGIARHALDAFTELARTKERPPAPKLSEQSPAQVALAHAEAKLRSGRAYFYEAVNELWTKTIQGDAVTRLDQANVRMAVLTAVENSLAAVDTAYRLAGSSAVFQNCPVERLWRDAHTAAQHVQTQDARWEDAGRVLMGLEPASVFF